MRAYLDLLAEVLEHGVDRDDRTGTGTRSVFGRQLRFDLRETFPLVTTKKVHLKSVIHELLWFLQGDTNVGYLQDNGVRIWNEWADDKGELGPVYGHQWRSWPTPDGGTVDQISQLIDQIRTNPTSRRLIVSAWNVGQLDKMALAPCHCLFQFYVADGKLSCQLYQRSADLFLGVPFNIASYALLTMMIANICDLQAHEFVHTFGDAHLYLNHFEQAREQLSREPRSLPTMKILRRPESVFDYRYEDFEAFRLRPAPAHQGEGGGLSEPKLALIVAVAKNGTIGRDGDLPWRLPADLKWFKQKTMGHHVVMGRKTYESLGGHPLPGRTKVVLTRARGFAAEGSAVVHDLPSAIALAADAGDDEVFVIGGAGVYLEALPMADRVYLTRVHADVAGDVALPAFAGGSSGGEEWVEVWREDHPADERHAHAFSWCILERTP